MSTTFRGAFTALVTPFRDGALDLDTLTALVARQIAAGIDGLVPCGTTGESPTLSFEEHQEIVRCVVQAAGHRVPVIAGAGSNDTAHAVALARANAACGATGHLVVSPYYNKPSQEGLYRHFAAVAAATPLPVILYNIPGRCGVTISNDTLRRLRRDLPNIVAVKHATGGVVDAAELLASESPASGPTADTHPPLAVLSGDDPLTLPLLSLGAVGVISVVSNVCPATVKRLTAAALAGDYPAARDAHAALLPLAQALLTLDTNPVPLKAALAHLALCREELRLPLCPLPAEKRAVLERMLADRDLS